MGWQGFCYEPRGTNGLRNKRGARDERAPLLSARSASKQPCSCAGHSKWAQPKSLLPH
jgi:hypothetical protein